MTELSFIIYKHIYIRKNIDKKNAYLLDRVSLTELSLIIYKHIYILKKKYRLNKCIFTGQTMTELSFLKILHFTFLARWLWRRFLNVVTVFELYRYHLHLEKGVLLTLTKVEYPVHKDILYQVWLKLTKWFWKRKMNIWKVYNDEYDREWKSEKKKIKSRLNRIIVVIWQTLTPYTEEKYMISICWPVDCVSYHVTYYVYYWLIMGCIKS